MTNDLFRDDWVRIQLYRRVHTDRIMGIATYTMGVRRINEIDGIAYFACVEHGDVRTLPNIQTANAFEFKPMKMTRGVLETYGYKPGRDCWFNVKTFEFKEVD